MEQTAISKVPQRTLRLLSTTAGSLLCVLLAIVTSLIFPHRLAVPLIFIGVAFVIAWIFGSGAGVLGSIGCALVFAYFFSPSGSFRVISGQARTNLEWLLLVGIPASYLFVPEKDGFIISRKR